MKTLCYKHYYHFENTHLYSERVENMFIFYDKKHRINFLGSLVGQMQQYICGAQQYNIKTTFFILLKMKKISYEELDKKNYRFQSICLVNFNVFREKGL